MLEPQLPHNRVQFDRLKRLQVLFVLAAPICAFLMSSLVIALPVGNLDLFLIPACVILLIVGIGVLEIKKTVIFQKDLHESTQTLSDKDVS